MVNKSDMFYGCNHCKLIVHIDIINRLKQELRIPIDNQIKLNCPRCKEENPQNIIELKPKQISDTTDYTIFNQSKQTIEITQLKKDFIDDEKEIVI